MNRIPRVSVALCTYNGEAFLREQLESFSVQTRLPDEVIVCDDGSTDGTMGLLTEYAASAPFHVHIHRNSVNLGSNRNFGQAITLCQGDILFLADQDDVWRSDKVATFVKEFDRHPSAGLVFSNAALVDSKRRPLGQRLWERVGIQLSTNEPMAVMDLFPRLTHEYLVTGATMAFRKEYVPAILPIGKNWVHDGWIAYIISAFADVVAIDDDLIEYRQHGAQQIGAPPQRTILGLRPSLRVASVLEFGRQVLFGCPTAQSGISSVTLKNDIEQTLIRYESALERLQLLAKRHVQPQVEDVYPAVQESPDQGIRSGALSRLEHRVAHLALRCQIRSCPGHGSKVVMAMKELWRGGYHRSGLGWLSFIRDATGI